ncbi:MAG TPA: DoxX family protein [Phycisphaerae bacterium]|nr:DoxX family protein [Phycisphaerae bacterium]
MNSTGGQPGGLPVGGAAVPAPLGPAARVGNTAFAMSVALLLLRLALGWAFVFHGSQKLFGAFDGPGIAGFAKYLHMPAFLPPVAWAYLAALAEFGGGALVLIGLLTRLATIPVLIVMFVAIATVTGAGGYSLPRGYEYNVALIAMAAALLIAGPGIISLDALLFRRGLWARGPQPLDQPLRRA